MEGQAEKGMQGLIMVWSELIEMRRIMKIIQHKDETRKQTFGIGLENLTQAADSNEPRSGAFESGGESWVFQARQQRQLDFGYFKRYWRR